MAIKPNVQRCRGTLVWCLFLLIILFLETASAMNPKHFPSKSQQHLIIWAGDQVLDQPNRAPDADFIAIIDANHKSKTFGEVINTAVIASIPGEHLLAKKKTLSIMP